MRRFWILFAFVAVACFYGFAQQALWSGAALKSPELRADRSAVFRLYAPEADSVSVSCDFLLVCQFKQTAIYGENGKGQHRGLDIHYASYACS